MNACSVRSHAPFIEVAPDTRLTHRHATLTYRVPPALDDEIEVGQLVWVPLRRTLALGIVAERHARPVRADVEVRELHAPVEPSFCLSSLQWQLATWLAEETVCSLFEAASVMLPPGVGTRAVEYLSLRVAPTGPEIAGLTPAQQRLVEFLAREGEVTLERAQRAQHSSLVTLVPALEERGILQKVARVRHHHPRSEADHYQVRLVAGAEPPPARATRQAEAFAWLSPRLRARPDGKLPLDTVLDISGIDRATLRALADRGCVAIEPLDTPAVPPAREGADVVLTVEQRRAWEQISLHVRGDRATHILLHGVTGSGKTELYLRAVADVLARGQSAIVLVPEIALSGQISHRFRERFGEQAIVLHSALQDRERYRNWQRAAAGEPLVVVGARSALFAPLGSVGIIVLDEEHDGSYKQDTVPRYHARAVATRLAELHGAQLILGSATPDVETYHASDGAGWTRVQLMSRVGQRAVDAFGSVTAHAIDLPEARIVDLRAELRGGNESIFSRPLMEVIHGRLAAGQQVILFLNRRGASTFIQCRSCGTVSQCPFCDIPLVYHRTIERLVCHRCGHRAPVPRSCGVCGSASVGFYGTGTQRVETEIQAHFPSARVLRWDQDAIRGRVTHETLLSRVVRQEVDIVVGTQMIAKGLDLPNVTAVGVVNADTYLYLPDIRAAERTFQMLTQVAGRAGRRAAGSAVIFQTYSPEHYAVVSAARHDYVAFYTEEIAFRRRHGYPPFKRLARLLYRHADDEKAHRAAAEMTDRLTEELARRRELRGVDIIGPAPAFATRVRGQYGWQILVRGDQLVSLLDGIDFTPAWVVDVDPVNLL
jgi:primosomal protein N' (replication factor Y)